MISMKIYLLRRADAPPVGFHSCIMHIYHVLLQLNSPKIGMGQLGTGILVRPFECQFSISRLLNATKRMLIDWSSFEGELLKCFKIETLLENKTIKPVHY